MSKGTPMKHRHGPECEWTVWASGQQVCKAYLAEKDERRRAQPEDGWEDEFGPVPPKERDAKWFDQVIVDRALRLQPTGRKPTPLEIRAIVSQSEFVPFFRENMAKRIQLAECVGVDFKTVTTWFSRYGSAK